MHRSKVFGAGLLLMAGLNGQDLESGKSPNVLLIIVDDLRNELNCYGVNYIKSPNIDQLAENGYLFNRAYVQHAVCSASRASFLTGCRPATTGVTYPYSDYFVNEFLPRYQTIPEFFEQQGYQVYTFGKVHHGSVGLDQLKTSHYSPTWLGHYTLEENIRLEKARGRNNLPPFESADVPDETYRDGAIANEAVEIIKRVSGNDEPFFLAVGFMKPHLPFNAPKQYWDMYTREEVGLADNRKHPEGSPSYSTSHHALNKYSGPNDEGGKMLPEEYQITLRHGYAACVSYIDAQVGKLITQLSESGVLDNTIVIFISDHGWHLGEQQMWGKTTNFENSTISPLIISIPGKAKGVNLDQFVEYVDIYPTLQELTGFPVSDHLEGTSFVPLLRDPGKKWKKAAFSQQNRGNRIMGYAIRTEDFRYVEWRRNEDNFLMAAELYDHRIDPVESKNLASEEAYKNIVADLSLELELGWEASLPPGTINRK
jgi:iduronate 2-sulfatase